MLAGQRNFARTLELRDASSSMLDAGRLGGALALYLAEYDAFSTRSLYEWRLAHSLVTSTTDPELRWPQHWPDDLLARDSGGTLCFIVSQLLGVDISPPPVLHAARSLTPKQRLLLAIAWILRPDCACLSSAEIRRPLAEQLASNPDTHAKLLLAAACCDDSELITTLRPRWERRGILRPTAEELVLSGLDHALLAEIALASLPTILARVSDINTRLGLLERGLSHVVERYAGEVSRERDVILLILNASRHLLSLTLDHIQRQRTLMVRLGALGALGTFEASWGRALSDEYGRLWRPTGCAFPNPEWLLYALQRIGSLEQERHLLRTAHMDGAAPWVQLAKRAVVDDASPAQLVDDWRLLYERDGDDERVLIGLTRALGHSPDQPLREDVRSRWQALLGVPGYHSLAAANLVQLNPEPRDLVADFERYLADRTLDDAALIQAARAYLRALGQLGRWDKIRSYLDTPQAGALATSIQFTERRFIQEMTKTELLPRTDDAVSEWLRTWERLLALPLEHSMLVGVLRQFKDKDRALRETSTGREIADSADYQDVELQLRRRAHAAAEWALAPSQDGQALPHPDQAEFLRALRDGADLTRTLSILDRLSP